MEIKKNVHNAFSILAGVLFFVGGCALLLTVHAEPPGGPTLDCGSAVTGLRQEVTSGALRVTGTDRANAAENGTTLDTSQKVTAHVTACTTAISDRRAWAWPTTAMGALGLAVLLHLARFLPLPPPGTRITFPRTGNH